MLPLTNRKSPTGNSEAEYIIYVREMVVAGVGFEPTTFRL